MTGLSFIICQFSICSVAAQKPMSAPKGGKAISDELIGIFFEDINNSADGGLYAELLQNGSFEYSPAERDGWGPGTAWKQIRPGHSLGTMQVRMDKPIHPNNPTYMRLHTERTREFHDYKGWKGFGLQNDGFDGISVKAGEKYDFSAFMRNIGNAKQVRIALVAQRQGWPPRDPRLLAEATLNVDAKDWKQYSAVLTPDSTCQNAALQILVLTVGDLDVDQFSLMPQDTYKGHGLRKDLALVDYATPVVVCLHIPAWSITSNFNIDRIGAKPQTMDGDISPVRVEYLGENAAPILAIGKATTDSVQSEKAEQQIRDYKATSEPVTLPPADGDRPGEGTQN